MQDGRDSNLLERYIRPTRPGMSAAATATMRSRL
jgi:hypothetical protein